MVICSGDVVSKERRNACSRTAGVKPILNPPLAVSCQEVEMMLFLHVPINLEMTQKRDRHL